MPEQTVCLPLLPLRGMVVFPAMMVHLDVGRKRSVAAVEQAMLADRKILLVAQRDGKEDEITEEDLYEVGTIAEIRRSMKMPDGTLRIFVEGLSRAEISEYHRLETYVEAMAIEHDDASTEEGETLKTDALVRSVVDAFEKWVKLSRKLPEEVLVSIAILDSAGQMADLIASHLSLKLEAAQKILACIDVKERLALLYRMLTRELDILALEQKIDAEVRQQMTKVQKDFYLREKIKAIRKELGEGDQKEEEVEAYRKKMKEQDLPQEVRKKLEEEIHRLESLNPLSPETGVIRGYLDWIFALPWSKRTEDVTDIEQARAVLERDHYGLKEVKERILDDLAVHQLNVEKSAPILCLVGPPGVGKTSFAASVARALGRQFVHVSLGGVRDEAEIRGHRRTYVGAMPGRILEGIRTAGTRNPVFLLDEIDKMTQAYSGDPAAAMLEVLDPEQNQAFVDHYLDLPFDLSEVLWIVTANNLGNIPRPLRDRMEIITLSSYTEYEKLAIAKKYLVARQRQENGLKAKDIRFGVGVLREIIASYTREAGVRELSRQIGKICRKAARRIVEGAETPVRVTKKDLVEFLDKPKFLTTKAEKQPQVGVAMGMAWTEVGGDILPTEATVLKGKGKLILTGQLGDVMQESAQAGLSYIRSRTQPLGLADDFYETADIHIHLPEGAIPKDGPSAGITMATAMISALTHRKVRSDLAMTGEITLRGNVLPIGGLKEKVLAAYREGIRTIVLPQENQRDIEEIPEEVRRDLTFHSVSSMDEVLSTALLPADREEATHA